MDIRGLRLLAKDFPDVRKAQAEIINLSAILNLPKGTEYFLSDLHGEADAFIHMMKSASGVIRRKIDEIFEGTLSEAEKGELAALIYDPSGELKRQFRKYPDSYNRWCKDSIYRLIEVLNSVSAKYSRSKVRKRLHPNSVYIMDELINADIGGERGEYYAAIIDTLEGCALLENFIGEIAVTIGRLAVDRLHIVGDIFDRGPRPDAIMDYLMAFHDTDFQWGNHDIVWLGAGVGNLACIANVVRLNISYNNYDMLEIGYGVNLRPLALFAAKEYADDPCGAFRVKTLDENVYTPVSEDLAAKMNKAIAVMQFKLEGSLIKRHPEYRMEGRLLLDKVDAAKGVLRLADGREIPMKDSNLPTVDPADPFALSRGEQSVMDALSESFLQNGKLQEHMRFIFEHGAMYRIANGMLLYHGCIPMTEGGAFLACALGEEIRSGKDWLDYLDDLVRRSYMRSDMRPPSEQPGDIMWYLWCGPLSPLFGKDRMATFERCFTDDKDARRETLSPYYKNIESEKTCKAILAEFGLDPMRGYIINGHVPVKIQEGESPVKGGGRLFIIDGGIAKAYQKTTGIAGYTFISSSNYIALAEHMPYSPPAQDGTQEFHTPKLHIIEEMSRRVTVRDTDTGEELEAQIQDLRALIAAFRNGEIKVDIVITPQKIL
ncbi:MAG: fructose-1,6-bisphosphatase [Clostridiales Family XIII bacterium]|jgi:fructose-1,6-bisphosphatase-3|nr:fructose-1,6-bisphosphatase [Clostridiales Family XIII bacterium]